MNNIQLKQILTYKLTLTAC